MKLLFGGQAKEYYFIDYKVLIKFFLELSWILNPKAVHLLTGINVDSILTVLHYQTVLDLHSYCDKHEVCFVFECMI